jgi:hypothetical protein
MKDEYLEVSNNEIIKMMKASKEFRNNVEYAHGYTNSTHSYYFKGTCSYPKRYKVNDELIQIAKTMHTRESKKVAKAYKNDLYFIGMGWHKADSVGDVGNCRIRTVLKNNDGKNIFIELSSGTNRSDKQKNIICCDFCFITEKIEGGLFHNDFKYNYKNLETSTYSKGIEWNKENILNFVNENLNCSFKNIYVDNFDNNLNEYNPICFSTKEV